MRCAAAAAVAAAAGAAAEQKCLAAVPLSPDDMGYALGVICDPFRLDCDPINVKTANQSGTEFWPDRAYPHLNWATNQYWKNKLSADGPHKDDAKGFCEDGAPDGTPSGGGVPVGKGKLFDCSDACTKCQLKAGTSDEAAEKIIGFLCKWDAGSWPSIMGPLCGAINPGGSMANESAVVRGSFAVNEYYQAHDVKCNLGKMVCGDGGDLDNTEGNGEIVTC